METILFQGQTAYQWKCGPSVFRAIPEKGARLLQWTLNVGGREREVIHWPDDADHSRLHKVRGGNPILFPFSARTFCDGEIGFWRGPDKVKRPMQMHGYARNGDFELVHADESGFCARFLPSEACREAYPFEYAFDVSYRFSDLELTVDLTLTNEGDKPLPWSAGHHFYFRLPWLEGTSRKDYRIEIPAKKALRQQGDGSLAPEDSFSVETSFDDPALSDRIHCRLKKNSVHFGSKNDEEQVTVWIGDTTPPPPWNSIVTWTMDDDSPFYCVEPWMGPPNSPEHRKGLHFVDPGQSETFRVRLSLL